MASVHFRRAGLPVRCRWRRSAVRAGRTLAPFVCRGLLAALVAVAATGVPGAARASSPSISFLGSQLRVGEVVRTRLANVTLDAFGYTWYRSSDGTNWQSIKISGTDSDWYAQYYTPVAADLGKYLRVVFTNGPLNAPTTTLEVVSAGVVAQQAAAPRLDVTELATGLSIPWDLAFAPDGSLLFTERGGALKVRRTDGSVASVAADLSDLWVEGNAGLKSIVADPAFETNRRFYTCQTHKDPKEIQVVAWTIDAAFAAATRVKDPLVGGIPRNDLGGHAGCRLRFGPNGYLYVSTGDGGGIGDPQSSSFLGGKVLRVDSSTGAAAPGNPLQSRVFTYGHRNPQGLALRSGGQMWSVEHGPASDDEVNLLVAGGNFGWNPYTAGGNPSYDDSSPMTDLASFPAALEAKWSSGTNTVANSGAVFLDGPPWGSWEGRLAVATLAQQGLRVIEFTSDGAFVSEIEPGALRWTYGRLRTPAIGPDKALYLTTSNSTDSNPNADKILRVVPRWTPPLVLDPPEATFGSASSTAEEGDGTHEVIVNLSPAPLSKVTVKYTVGGTASTPGDFGIGGLGELSIPAGAPRAVIEVELVDDGDHESDETVVLTLGSGEGYAVGDSSTYTLTIESDDSASSPPGGSPPPPPDPDPDPSPDPPPPPSGPPEARIVIDGADCGTDFCVAMTGTRVVLRDVSAGAVFGRSWDAGDGARSSSSSFVHAWSAPGYYVVSLRVSGGGVVSEATRTVLARPAEPAGTCEPDAATLCLRDERFSVSVEWFTGDGASGRARVVYVGTNDSGLFRFFDGENWEVLAKVLDGCSINGHVWVLAASTTDLGYRILVTDTATGETKAYTNEAGQPSPSIVDVKAFGAACGA